AIDRNGHGLHRSWRYGRFCRDSSPFLPTDQPVTVTFKLVMFHAGFPEAHEPVVNVTSEYECASAKAAKYASVQELGPTPAWVMSWRQADSTRSGSVAKTNLRSARNCAKVSHAWTPVRGVRPITLEFVNRRSRPIWV